MNYKLKSYMGKVTFLLKAGNDLVRNQMRVAAAQHIIDTGTIKNSDIKDFPINVDDKWFFEGEPITLKKTRFKKSEEVE